MKPRYSPDSWREVLVRYGELIHDIEQGNKRCRVFYYKTKIYCVIEQDGDVVCVTRGGMEGNIK